MKLAFGDLNGDSSPDAAILASGEVLALYSSAGPKVAQLAPLSLPVSASALALGRFMFDRNPQLQIALLGSDGSIHIAAHSGLDSRPWSAGTFTLTIPNNFKYNATGGHLDINDGLTIMGSTDGSGNPTTIIQAGTSTSNGIDKVFSIAAPPLTGGFGPSFATSFSNLER